MQSPWLVEREWQWLADETGAEENKFRNIHANDGRHYSLLSVCVCVENADLANGVCMMIPPATAAPKSIPNLARNAKLLCVRQMRIIAQTSNRMNVSNLELNFRMRWSAVCVVHPSCSGHPFNKFDTKNYLFDEI